jgi:hypothetical protein
LTREKIRIGEIEGGSDEAAHIDLCTRAKDYTLRIEENDLPVGIELTKYG